MLQQPGFAGKKHKLSPCELQILQARIRSFVLARSHGFGLPNAIAAKVDRRYVKFMDDHQLDNVIVVTTNHLPGFEIVAVLGKSSA